MQARPEGPGDLWGRLVRAGAGCRTLAGNADPVTGYQIYYGGQAQVVGGTSAVAPLIARLAQATGARFGLLQPLLYASISPGTDVTERIAARIRSAVCSHSSRRLTGQGAQGYSRHYQRGSAVTLRPEEPSGGRSPTADVPDEVIAGQDGGADAADEEDQHPDGVQVGRCQPERADDQPEQDDQSHRCDVSTAHMPDAPLGER